MEVIKWAYAVPAMLERVFVRAALQVIQALYGHWQFQ